MEMQVFAINDCIIVSVYGEFMLVLYLDLREFGEIHRLGRLSLPPVESTQQRLRLGGLIPVASLQLMAGLTDIQNPVLHYFAPT